MTRYSPRFSFGFLSGRRRNTKFEQRESEKGIQTEVEEEGWEDDEEQEEEEEEAVEEQESERDEEEVSDISSIGSDMIFYCLSSKEEVEARAKEQLFSRDKAEDKETLEAASNDDDYQWIDMPIANNPPRRVAFHDIQPEREHFRNTFVRHSGYIHKNFIDSDPTFTLIESTVTITASTFTVIGSTFNVIGSTFNVIASTFTITASAFTVIASTFTCVVGSTPKTGGSGSTFTTTVNSSGFATKKEDSILTFALSTTFIA
ncbi:hypothetical protein BGZ65_000920 [Modicella reniformis]|uniref:Uncharacterized protein n=1 Tax=Modicella reniformis TaxID=1440133 RepID=A0A9P6J2R5_9FUNG|nr:hypothetical protein BGZ65_000920 [Modicella reniformis]